MPTEEQLDILFESELEFKPRNIPKSNNKEFTGKRIGTIKYNPKTKRVDFTPLNPEKGNNRQNHQ